MIQENKLRIDHVHVERSEIEETGEYDLEALFIRLDNAINSIGAKRVVLDTIESLFGGIDNTTILRAEIRRLFHWLKVKGVTAVITGERGEASLTRQGLEEYVSDCVILLDFRVIQQIATRRLRIIKYRGSTHGTNEYPFLIDEDGISVLPITSLKLEYKSSSEIIPTGILSLDKLLAKGGVYCGNCTLITGSAGTLKTTIAGYFAKSNCMKKNLGLFFSFEESPDQLIRNLSSIGLDISGFIKSKLLYVHCTRPSLQGLEMHLLLLHKLIEEYDPKVVILDPISSLITVGSGDEVRAMLVRLMDMLKGKNISAMFTALTHKSTENNDLTVNAVSSLADVWINVFYDEKQDKNTRKLEIVKARGMGHSNGVWDILVNSKGIELVDSNRPNQ
jgi:circadian clock protein KaiC